MANVKFIFFDLANTLVHLPTFYESVHHFLNERNIQIRFEELKKSHRLLSEEIQFPDKTSKEFYMEFNSIWMNRIGIAPDQNLAEAIYDLGTGHHWKIFEDTKHLENITIPKGIISNWDFTLPQRLEGFFDFKFDLVIGSAIIGFQKPDKRIFESAIRQSGYTPEEIMMVGDSIRLDVLPAAELGMKAFLIDRDGIFTNFSGYKLSGLHELKNYL